MKKKALKAGVASVLALGAGVAAINARKNYKAEKVQVKKHQEEELANFRNTERGTNEKNSKGIYYSNGNYEAFARPEKPEGIENKSAYLVGSGLASLAAACFLVRDAQMPGKNIHILEAMDIAGGACDGINDPTRGYVMRGGREMENHFECLWDLFRSIPSLETEGALLAEQARSELLSVPCNREPRSGCSYRWQVRTEPERLHGDHEAVLYKGRGSVRQED